VRRKMLDANGTEAGFRGDCSALAEHYCFVLCRIHTIQTTPRRIATGSGIYCPGCGEASPVWGVRKGLLRRQRPRSIDSVCDQSALGTVHHRTNKAAQRVTAWRRKLRFQTRDVGFQISKILSTIGFGSVVMSNFRPELPLLASDCILSFPLSPTTARPAVQSLCATHPPTHTQRERYARAYGRSLRLLWRLDAS